MSVVASNVRKILSFLHTMKRGTPADSKNRAEVQEEFVDTFVEVDAVETPPPPE